LVRVLLCGAKFGFICNSNEWKLGNGVLVFSNTRLHLHWESKPSKTDDNAPNRNFRCMPPSPFSFRVAQARMANHVTTTFFTIRAASAKQLQFVLISSIEIFPILLHLPNLDHQI
jgi:hypothetical protein